MDTNQEYNEYYRDRIDIITIKEMLYMLSNEEARNVVEDLLVDIRKEINIVGESHKRFSYIEKISPYVKREGNTPDVFCKIAEVAYEYGLSTDISVGSLSGTLLIFSPAGADYSPPSPQICEEKWRWMEEKRKEMVKKMEDGSLEVEYPPYVVAHTVKKLEDLPRKAAIYILRVVNAHRAKGEIDEFIEHVLLMTFEKAMKDFPCVLDIAKCFYPERKEEIEELKKEIDNMLVYKTTDIGDIYTIFSTFGEHFFITFDEANYFQNEPEYNNLIGKTVFDAYPTEVDPSKIKKLDDLTKKDAQRLIRVINSFRRKDVVDRFLSEIGDFENIYELFQLYIGYIFHEYENAHYFLDEPELDPKEKEFQTVILNRPTKFEGEFD